MASTSALIKSLLRVITPEEINELTTTFDSKEKVALTDLINDFLFSSPTSETNSEDEEEDKADGAKILPFSKSGPEKEEDEASKEYVIECGKNVSRLLSSFLEKEKLKKGGLFSAKRPKKTYQPRSKEMGRFVIDEKKKLEKTYHKLKSREVLELYQKNAALSIDKQKDTSKDLLKSSEYGVLVNKK